MKLFIMFVFNKNIYNNNGGFFFFIISGLFERILRKVANS